VTSVRACVASIGAVALAGCGSLIASQPDDLSTWQRAPIPPDPRIAAMATEACRPLDENFVVQVILQDRRTESTAAFLLAGPGWTGSCLTSLAGGGAGSDWRSGPLEVMDDPIVVDERSTGDVAEGTASILGGRTAADVGRVEIVLDDGGVVTASVGAGHWLAWWPGTVTADRITATSADGHVAVLAWRDGGWAIQ
jgi:hypothetical protein